MAASKCFVDDSRCLDVSAVGMPMQVVRVLNDEDCRYGLADDDTVTLISDEPFAAWEPEGVLAALRGELLAPVVPTKIVCVGLNYRATRRDGPRDCPSEPVIFLKPSTAVIGPDAPSRSPPASAGSTTRPSSASSSAGARTTRAATTRAPTSSATRAATTSPRATCSSATASGRARRASTGSARSGRGSRPTSTRATSSSSATERRASSSRAARSDMIFDPYELVRVRRAT